MAVEWESAPAVMVETTQRLVARYHPHLRGKKIGLLMRSEGLRVKGRAVYGRAMKPPTALRVWLDYDFVLWVAKDAFAQFDGAQREALLDHLLCHCRVQGEYETPALVGPDVTEFAAVIQRHGFWWPGSKAAASAWAGAVQAPLMDDETQGSVEAVPLSDTVRAHVDALHATVRRIRADDTGVSIETGGTAEVDG